MSKVWGDAQNELSELKQGEVIHAREAQECYSLR